MEEDVDFLRFVEQLNKLPEFLPSAEVQYEDRKRKEEKEGQKPKTTPILEELKAKAQNHAKPKPRGGGGVAVNPKRPNNNPRKSKKLHQSRDNSAEKIPEIIGIVPSPAAVAAAAAAAAATAAATAATTPTTPEKTTPTILVQQHRTPRVERDGSSTARDGGRDGGSGAVEKDDGFVVGPSSAPATPRASLKTVPPNSPGPTTQSVANQSASRGGRGNRTPARPGRNGPARGGTRSARTKGTWKERESSSTSSNTTAAPGTNKSDQHVTKIQVRDGSK